jgi:hypothetical protein
VRKGTAAVEPTISLSQQGYLTQGKNILRGWGFLENFLHMGFIGGLSLEFYLSLTHEGLFGSRMSRGRRRGPRGEIKCAS